MRLSIPSMLLILGLHMGSNERANGMAQRQRRDGRDSYHFRATSGKTRLRASGRAAACTERSECVRLPAPVFSGPAPVLSGEPVLGAFLPTNELTEFGD